MPCIYSMGLSAPRLSAKDTSSTSRKKDRSRSKSPFRSFRWKKGSGPKSPTLAPTSASDDESNMEREGQYLMNFKWTQTSQNTTF